MPNKSHQLPTISIHFSLATTCEPQIHKEKLVSLFLIFGALSSLTYTMVSTHRDISYVITLLVHDHPRKIHCKK